MTVAASSDSPTPAAAPPALNLNVVPSADGSTIVCAVTVDGDTWAGTLQLQATAVKVGSYLYAGKTVTPQSSGS